MMQKQPEVTTQTRKNLMNAFWTLYRENGMENVTVGAVTKLAGYNRGTFYEYFTDIYDLLTQIEDELLSSIEADLRNNIKAAPSEDFAALSAVLTDLFTHYGDRVFVLVSSHGDPGFTPRLIQTIRPVIFSFSGIDENDPYLEYYVTYSFSALLGLVSRWYERGQDIEVTRFVHLIQSLISDGIRGIADIHLSE